MTDPASGGGEVEVVRGELQRLGYLTHRVERYLLQDALRPERPLATVAVLAAKLGLLGGSLLAVAGALLLLLWNPQLGAAPLDLALLVVHLLPPLAALVGASFLTLAAVVAAALRFWPALRIDTLSLAVGLAGGLGLLGAALWRGRALLSPLPPGEAALLAAGGAIAAYVLGRLLYQGLLALAIRLTDRAPRRRLLLPRYLLPAVALVALALVALPATVAARRPLPAPAGFLPVASGEGVLLVAIDGVLPTELDFLLQRRELPAVAGLLARGGALMRYRRNSDPPAAFWTTVATGLEAPEHGVAAVDTYRPLGLETALAVSGPFRWYWADVERPLGLARHRPLLSNKRSAFTFWELLAHGGTPVAAVDWWGTYPAGDLPGLVVAHGGYQLLGQGADGAVAPPTRRVELSALRRRVAAGADDSAVAVVRAALPPAEAARLAAVALLPESFYRQAFAAEVAQGRRAAALYLAALDLAATGWRGGAVAFGELLTVELGAADRMLAQLLARGSWDTVIVVWDPGRRGAGQGRALLWRRQGCRGLDADPEVAPAALGAALFRAAGLPQSEELPAPPSVCRWSPPPGTVESFGRRAPAAESARGDEYLQNLHALGYL